MGFGRYDPCNCIESETETMQKSGESMIQNVFIKSVLLGFITATIFCAQSATAGTVLGYHWQNPEGNRDLLEAAGLNPDKINLEELNVQNVSITPNGRFFELIRKWYSKNETDAAGAGFYFSSDPLDTFEQGYGSDLLIVELNLRDTSTLDQFKHQSGFKKISDSAIEDGKESKLPVISRVYSDFGWYVITRPSNLMKVQISIRKPSPKDVGVIYESWKKRSDFLSIMVRLAKIVTDPKKSLSAQVGLYFIAYSLIILRRILISTFLF